MGISSINLNTNFKENSKSFFFTKNKKFLIYRVSLLLNSIAKPSTKKPLV